MWTGTRRTTSKRRSNVRDPTYPKGFAFSARWELDSSAGRRMGFCCFSPGGLLMLRALCLAMTVLVVPGWHASAEAGTDLGENAALKYWQAFTTLPRFSGIEQGKLSNGQLLSVPLGEDARVMVAKAAYALRMMHCRRSSAALCLGHPLGRRRVRKQAPLPGGLGALVLPCLPPCPPAL